MSDETEADAPIAVGAEGIGERLAIAGIKEQETREFLETLQAAVGRNDSSLIASLVEYPLKVDIDGEQMEITNSEQFVGRYDQIVTQTVRDAVLRQEYDDLFANWQGVMIGRGQVWFSGICHDVDCSEYELRIIAISGHSWDFAN